jgi:Transglutaminase-like superfamily
VLRPQLLPHGWRRLTLTDWRLLAALAAAQVIVAAALRTMPLPALRARGGRVRRLARALVRGADERIVWAIEATGRRLGRLSSCLVRALVAEVVLDSNDGPVHLTIGVKRTGDALEAHAWVTQQNHILIGATSDQFIPLVTWPSHRSGRLCFEDGRLAGT